MFSIFLQPSVEGIEIKCVYEFQSNKCQVHDVDLSNIFRVEYFEFSVSAEEMNKTTVIEFLDGHVDFIPSEVVDQFPNLIELEIRGSDVPIIKNDFFSSKFDKIKRLEIVGYRTVFIEEKAFTHLKNLEELELYVNKIKSLNFALFSNNRKLKRIDLSDNQITAIHPKLFENLNHLSFIDLGLNECIDKKFGCENCTNTIDHEELNRGLSLCYFHCFVDNECGKNLNAIANIKCEFSEGLFEISKDLNFKTQQCKIKELKIGTKSTAKMELFSGSKNEKQNVTMLDINQKIYPVDKIPREIFQEFPSLSQLKISNMGIYYLQDNFFSTDFMKIEYLDLSHNRIEEIEENAFENSVSLKWLNLESNDLGVLHSFEFRNNKKLEYINFSNNPIEKINRRAFKDLNNLKFVQFEKNGEYDYVEIFCDK